MIGRVVLASVLCGAALVGAAIEWREVGGGDAWTLVDALGGTAFLASLPANSVLLAPHLWDGANVPAGGDRYLSDYVSNLAGHPLRVTRSSGDVFDLLRQGVPVYYCERQWLPGRRVSVLLISRLHASDSDAAPLAGDSVTVVASTKLPHLAMEYRLAGAATGRGSTGVSQVSANAWREDGGAYLADAPTPGWAPGTARLVDEETGAPLELAVAIDFGAGFAQITERSGGHYFRWTDSPDGQAELDLVNSLDHPLTVRFRATMRFNPTLRTGAFDLTTPAGKESARLENLGLLDRVWTLQPGSNPVVIQCRENRIPTPNDRRHIFFGLWDWAVTPVSSTEARQ